MLSELPVSKIFQQDGAPLKYSQAVPTRWNNVRLIDWLRKSRESASLLFWPHSFWLLSLGLCQRQCLWVLMQLLDPVKASNNINSSMNTHKHASKFIADHGALLFCCCKRKWRTYWNFNVLWKNFRPFLVVCKKKFDPITFHFFLKKFSNLSGTFGSPYMAIGRLSQLKSSFSSVSEQDLLWNIH